MKRSEFYQAEDRGWFYRIGSQEGVFCYLLIGTQKALLFDTTNGFGDLAGCVRNLTDLPLIIVDSHGHWDHAGGNCQFQEPIYLHSADFDLCRDATSYDKRRENALAMQHTMNYFTHEITDITPEDFDLEHFANGGSGNLVPLQDNMVFDLGGLTAQIVHTPGHTKGEVSLYVPEKNAAFIGDTTSRFTWLYLEESGTLADYQKSMDRLINLQADHYYAGHDADIPYENLKRYQRAAQEADYAKGIPFEGPESATRHPRVCALDGMTMADLGRDDFASVVIGPDAQL